MATGRAGCRALLPAEDPEEEERAAPARAALGVLGQVDGWRRRARMYAHSADLSLEISFRGAVWLLLLAVPNVWGLARDPDSFFHEDRWQGRQFQTTTILTFVYTLAPTFGRTFTNAGRALAGTFAAAAYSLLMYLVYPDGCSGAEALGLCHVFGVLAGAASVACCLLLDLGLWFHVFYCSNFVFFWMAFLDPETPPRTALDFQKERIFGFEFADWGGGVFGYMGNVATGASLAVIATLLPYPITSMERARDCAYATVGMLEKTWTSAVDFYVADDRDEWRAAKMASEMQAFKDHSCTLKGHLDNCWWEMYLLKLACCGRTWRLRHSYLTALEATTSSCLDRLTHVVAACMRENFEDVHDELMKPERCGNAVRALSRSTGALLGLALECADGNTGAGEKEELMREAEGVEKAEITLSRQMWESVADISKDAVKNALRGEADAISEGRKEQIRKEQLHVVAHELTDEQTFVFCLCHFASSVRGYCKLLAEHSGASPRLACNWTGGLRKVFDEGAIMAPANRNYALRHCVAIFVGFAIGYVGYSEMIKAKSALIPSTVAVLLSQSLSTPMEKSLSGRLLGVVLGKFSGQLAYALLGWCAIWAQVSLSTIVFAYVWVTLFLYHHCTGMLSDLGCLAAAFGTKQLLGGNIASGCSDEVVTPRARNIVATMIAIMLMAITDFILKMGSPSDLAYGAYLEALAAWDNMLEDLLTDKDTNIDPLQVTTFINKAEAYGRDAASEPIFWRPPFQVGLFSEMIGLVKTMRAEAISIHDVICQKQDGTFSKTQWFKDIVADQGSGWPAFMSSVLEEMDITYDSIQKLAEGCCNKAPGIAVEKIRREKRSHRKKTQVEFTRHSLFERREEMGAQTVTLTDDEVAQKNFVYGALQTIKDANLKMRLEIVKQGL